MFTIVESSTTISWAPAMSNSNNVLFELRRALVGSAARFMMSVIASPDRLETGELRLDRLVQMRAHRAADVVGEHFDLAGFDAVEHLADDGGGISFRCLHGGCHVGVDVADVHTDDLHAARRKLCADRV